MFHVVAASALGLSQIGEWIPGAIKLTVYNGFVLTSSQRPNPHPYMWPGHILQIRSARVDLIFVRARARDE